MKKLIVLAALAAAVAFPSSAEMRIASVNMVDLVRFHPDRPRDRKLMKETEQGYQEKIDAAREEIENLGATCRSIQDEMQNPVLSTAAKQKAQDRLEAAQKKFFAAQQTFRIDAQHYQGELQDLDTRLLKATTEAIRAKINAYAAEKKYDLIVDSSMVAFAAKSLDVTDDILKLMGVDPAKARAEAKATEGAELSDAADADAGRKAPPTVSTLPVKAAAPKAAAQSVDK